MAGNNRPEQFALYERLATRSGECLHLLDEAGVGREVVDRASAFVRSELDRLFSERTATVDPSLIFPRTREGQEALSAQMWEIHTVLVRELLGEDEAEVQLDAPVVSRIMNDAIAIVAKEHEVTDAVREDLLHLFSARLHLDAVMARDHYDRDVSLPPRPEPLEDPMVVLPDEDVSYLARSIDQHWEVLMRDDSSIFVAMRKAFEDGFEQMILPHVLEAVEAPDGDRFEPSGTDVLRRLLGYYRNLLPEFLIWYYEEPGDVDRELGVRNGFDADGSKIYYLNDYQPYGGYKPVTPGAMFVILREGFSLFPTFLASHGYDEEFMRELEHLFFNMCRLRILQEIQKRALQQGIVFGATSIGEA